MKYEATRGQIGGEMRDERNVIIYPSLLPWPHSSIKLISYQDQEQFPPPDQECELSP